MDGPRVMVTQHCAITFSISPFHDTIICDMSPLDCTDVFLGTPYHELHHTVYHARNHQYNLQKDGCIYVLTSSFLKFVALRSDQTTIHQISLNKSISLCLVCPLKPDNPSHALPSDMDALITSFEDVFVAPTRLPPICSIEHSTDIIARATFPNAPSYRLAPREAEEVERQLQQLLNISHIQPSSSPCASLAFIISKKEYE
jgi:hypothetical protein